MGYHLEKLRKVLLPERWFSKKMKAAPKSGDYRGPVDDHLYVWRNNKLIKLIRNVGK